jgi:hypothetical protein
LLLLLLLLLCTVTKNKDDVGVSFQSIEDDDDV